MQKRSSDTAAMLRTPAGKLGEGRLGNVLGYQLAQATIVTSQVFAHTVAAVHKLRPVEYTVLALVSENEGVTAARLASALAVTPPNMATWIDRLNQRGLVRREEHVRDRRALHIHTTKAGRDLVARATELVCVAELSATSGLTPAERAMLLELLHKIASCRVGR